MLKWTDFNNIKVIILDIDSLTDELVYFRYKEYFPNVEIYKVRKKSVSSKINIDEDIEYYSDLETLLYTISVNIQILSASIISISSNILFLKKMMQFHIGTILFSDSYKETLKNIPDFIINSTYSLIEIFSKKLTGYASEVIACDGVSRPTMILLNIEKNIDLSNGKKKSTSYVIGGRYYSVKNSYLNNDPLSTLILKFKNEYVERINLFYDLSISYLTNKNDIDVLTYIPLKPNDLKEGKFNRFKSLKLNMTKENGYELKEIIKCTKNFSQKNNGYKDREKTVKGAFKLLDSINIEGKNILIIDDIYTTGFTMNEAVKTLYENGANNVIALILGVNQLIDKTIQFKNLKCSYCNGPMKLNYNQSDDKLFYGCSNYLNHKKENTTIGFYKGYTYIRMLNNIDFNIINSNNENKNIE